MLVLLVVLHLEMCSLRFLAGPIGQTSWLVWTRRTVFILRSSSIPALASASLVLLVLRLALCSLLCHQVLMLSIMAGMKEKHTHAVGCGLVLLVAMLLALYSLPLSAARFP